MSVTSAPDIDPIAPPGTTVAGDGLITLECPECDEVITGVKSGGGGAAFKLARHRKAAHGVQGKKAQARAAARSGGDDDGDEGTSTRVLSNVRDIADAVGGGKRVPTANDLAKGLGRGLGLSTTAIAAFMVESDPNIPEGPEGERIRDGLVDYLSLSDPAAVAIMGPVGRALAPTKINKKYGRQIVENVDLAASISELGILAIHWRKYMRQRNQMSAPQHVSVQPITAGFEPVVTEAGQTTTPPPQTGRVLSGADIEAMQQRQRGL